MLLYDKFKAMCASCDGSEEEIQKQVAHRFRLSKRDVRLARREMQKPKKVFKLKPFRFNRKPRFKFKKLF